MDGEMESRKGGKREREGENKKPAPEPHYKPCVMPKLRQGPGPPKWGTFREGGGRHPRVLAGHLVHMGAQGSFSQDRYRSEGLWACVGPPLATLPTWDDKW